MHRAMYHMSICACWTFLFLTIGTCDLYKKMKTNWQSACVTFIEERKKGKGNKLKPGPHSCVYQWFPWNYMYIEANLVDTKTYCLPYYFLPFCVNICLGSPTGLPTITQRQRLIWWWPALTNSSMFVLSINIDIWSTLITCTNVHTGRLFCFDLTNAQWVRGESLPLLESKQRQWLII